jgi:hypothetical protein
MISVVENSRTLGQALFEAREKDASVRDRIIQAALQSLQQINEAGVFHLDLKPEHLLVTGEADARQLLLLLTSGMPRSPRRMTGSSWSF